MRTLAAVAALGVATAGGTQYGGALVHGRAAGAVTIGLTRAADGSVAARFGFAVRCDGVLWRDRVIRARGTSSGTTFRASGHTRAGRAQLTMTVTGRFNGAAVSGHLTARGKGCDELTRAPFRLRAAALPAGAPALPARGTVLFGVTSQSAGGVRLPVTVFIAEDGRVTGSWEALASCAHGRIRVMNVEPLTQLRADGSFSRSERYVVGHEKLRVRFTGRFVSGGAAGTLSARSGACSTGPQTWSATP